MQHQTIRHKRNQVFIDVSESDKAIREILNVE